MKFPSFLKVPRHQRFRFDPRYYDPVKEEIAQRVSRIKREISDNEDLDGEEDYKQRIATSFQRRIYDRRPQTRSGVLQFIIMIILFGGFVGYIYLGNIALYTLFFLLVLYTYLRIRRFI